MLVISSFRLRSNVDLIDEGIETVNDSMPDPSEFLFECWPDWWRDWDLSQYNKDKKTMNNLIKLIKLKLLEFLPWFIAAFAVLSSSWASNAISDLFSSEIVCKDLKFYLSRLFIVLLFIFCVILLYFQRKAFFRPRTRYLIDNEKPEPRKGSVFFFVWNW